MSNQSGFFSKWTGKLTGFVSMLVVIPSVFNAGSDIWVSWNDLPIGDKEKTNTILFKDHWKESPVHTKQIIVEAQKRKIPITVDIYRNGDIFIDYGRSAQWFSYVELNLSQTKFSLISSAHADELPTEVKEIAPAPVIIINEKDDDNNIVRSKILDDGSIEKTTLDPNTAKTLSFEVIPAPENVKKPIEIEPTEIITIPDEKKESVEVIVIEETNGPQ
jgi:hypothetical protein